MNTFKIDFHINPYITIYCTANMHMLTQFWFGNLFYHVPSYYYTLIGGIPVFYGHFIYIIYNLCTWW